jgi:hypothetical protein
LLGANFLGFEAFVDNGLLRRLVDVSTQLREERIAGKCQRSLRPE